MALATQKMNKQKPMNSAKIKRMLVSRVGGERERRGFSGGVEGVAFIFFAGVILHRLFAYFFLV